jgi:uncharacterized protein (TIGR03067 family)
MKKFVLFTASSLAILFGGCTAMPENSSTGSSLMRAPQSGEMSGTWVPVSNAMAGKSLEFPTGFELKIEGDRYRAGVPPSYNDYGRIEVIATNSGMMHLDLKSEVGQNKGKIIPAIARMNGKELEVCYDLSMKRRPADFVSREGTQQLRVSYARK